MHITEFPARLSQHNRVLRKIQGVYAKFSFRKCFRNTGFCPKRNLQNHPLQCVCLSLVRVMTSLACFAIYVVEGCKFLLCLYFVFVLRVIVIGL